VKGKQARPRGLRWWLAVGSILVSLLLLLIFALVAGRRPARVATPSGREGKPAAGRPADYQAGEEFPLPVGDWLQQFFPVAKIRQAVEWVREGSHRWLLRRWEVTYHDPARMAQLAAVCRRAAAKLPPGYQLLSHVDQEKTYFFLLLYRGRLIGTLKFSYQEPVRVQAPARKIRPRVAIIIDDMGMNLEIARQFAALPQALTFSVFPYAPHAREVAALLRSHGKQVMLHVPMEPHGYPDVDPGPGALFVRMSDRQLLRQFQADLEQVPGIVGLNNHMGSRLTEDRRSMAAIMRYLQGKDFFFIDSRTSAATVAYEEAVRFGVPAGKRDVFLDNIKNEQYILKQVEKLLEIALVAKHAVGIGHPYPETVAALRRLSTLKNLARTEIVPVSEIVHR